MCNEYPELRASVKDSIIEAANIMLKLELDFIDKMFEQGDLENLKSSDLKEFIKRRINEKIKELGYTEGPFFEYDEDAANELEWFYHLTGGVKHTDFFAMRPTDYSKQGADEDWDDIF